MSSYNHFTLEEREYLQNLLSRGLSFRKIAQYMDRSPSTISREVNRNKAQRHPHHKPNNSYWYNAWRAQNLYVMRRRATVRQAIKADSEIWNYITDKLSKHWSPEQICARWHLENPDAETIHYSTVYRYIYKKRFPEITAKSHLRRHGKRMLPKASCYNSIQPDRIIPQWPEVIKNRARIGDWEGDTVYGGIGKGLLVTQVDRKSRFLQAGLIASRDSKMTKDCIVKLLKNLPVKSISLDNGSEFSEFRALEEELNTEVYFAEPHKPWQRGTNENTNDILRTFFPKGFDFRTITQDDVDAVVELVNSRPRKILGWKTPAEIFYQQSVALD